MSPVVYAAIFGAAIGAVVWGIALYYYKTHKVIRRIPAAPPPLRKPPVVVYPAPPPPKRPLWIVVLVWFLATVATSALSALCTHLVVKLLD